LDTRGISTWSNTNDNVERHVTFPKYQNRLLRFLLFCEKHHVYFAICNDFTLQVPVILVGYLVEIGLLAEAHLEMFKAECSD